MIDVVIESIIDTAVDTTRAENPGIRRQPETICQFAAIFV